MTRLTEEMPAMTTAKTYVKQPIIIMIIIIIIIIIVIITIIIIMVLVVKGDENFLSSEYLRWHEHNIVSDN